MVFDLAIFALGIQELVIRKYNKAIYLLYKIIVALQRGVLIHLVSHDR